jgi:ABC-type bacteriocin/lantibiotic exporter with double-glycine peptidase domain
MFIGIKTFPLSLQRDTYSCGSRAVYSVLFHFGIHRPHRLVKSQLATNPTSGTAVRQMIRVLRGCGLKVGYRPYLSWRELAQSLRKGAVALVHLDGDHFAVAHGLDSTHVHLADPSIIRCAGRRQTRQRFLARWSRWGLLIWALRNRRKRAHFPASRGALR